MLSLLLESTRTKSLRGRPSTEPSTVSLAPVSETSCIVHGHCHVPSIAIMFAAKPALEYDAMGLTLFHYSNRRTKMYERWLPLCGWPVNFLLKSNHVRRGKRFRQDLRPHYLGNIGGLLLGSSFKG